MRAWETKHPLGRGRVIESIDRYSTYHGQTVDRFGFLAEGFLLNAYGLTLEAAYRRSLALYGFEPNSSRVVLASPTHDPFFQHFETFLRQRDFAMQPSFPPSIRKGRDGQSLSGL